MKGLALMKNLKSLFKIKNKKTIPMIEIAGRPFVNIARPVDMPNRM
jgi:hypothetical protein